MRDPQEDLFLVEALAEHHTDRMDGQPERASRAWALAGEIATSHGLEMENVLRKQK
ncbi:hypothetical protein [Natrinema soli]|uniref:Uncharacterized protein n=1 Tax=Natrinema soli TaxID=1930624 RepID=A0ABD5STE6_9EURY|nr:hypothetical protein [Natrinema soli]